MGLWDSTEKHGAVERLSPQLSESWSFQPLLHKWPCPVPYHPLDFFHTLSSGLLFLPLWVGSGREGALELRVCNSLTGWEPEIFGGKKRCWLHFYPFTSLPEVRGEVSSWRHTWTQKMRLNGGWRGVAHEQSEVTGWSTLQVCRVILQFLISISQMKLTEKMCKTNCSKIGKSVFSVRKPTLPNYSTLLFICSNLRNHKKIMRKVNTCFHQPMKFFLHLIKCNQAYKITPDVIWET